MNNAEQRPQEPQFTASLSKGRQKWCAIFRHPLIPDEATGKPGARVRRGLGADDKAEAMTIIDDLNAMLVDRDFWQLGAREIAARRFQPKAVSAFYDHDRLRPALTDPWIKRDKILPLPTAEQGYSVVQVVGPFAAGKTTLVRQLIGTRAERFPSTAKGRTTICDTEIICAPGTYTAVVSFLSGRERSNDVRMIDEDVAQIPSDDRASKLFDDIRRLCREAIVAAGGEVQTT